MATFGLAFATVGVMAIGAISGTSKRLWLLFVWGLYALMELVVIGGWV